MKVFQITNMILEYNRRTQSIRQHMANYREYKYFDNNDEMAEQELQLAEQEEQELGKFLNMEI